MHPIERDFNAQKTARQLSQATMHFEGLQFDDQLVRTSKMPIQLNLVSPPRLTPLNAIANDPLILKQPHSHINAPNVSPQVLNSIAPQFQLILPAFCFAPAPLSPPQPALPLDAKQLPPSLPAQNIFPPANDFVPYVNYPPAPEHKYTPICSVPSTNAVFPLPNANVWRFLVSVSAI